MSASKQMVTTAFLAAFGLALSGAAASAADKSGQSATLKSRSEHSYGSRSHPGRYDDRGHGGHHSDRRYSGNRDRHPAHGRPHGYPHARPHGGHHDSRHPVYGSHSPRHYGTPQYRGHYPHHRPHPVRYDHRAHRGYYCSHCNYRTSSYSIFYQHLFHRHHIPWFEIAAHIVFDPVRLHFFYGGH